MKNQSRRNFLGVAAGAYALTALQGCESSQRVPSGKQSTANPTQVDKPLAINFIGPMGFRKNISAQTVDVWLPELDSNCHKPHQAGLVTSAGSIVLPESGVTDYNLTGPITGGNPQPYGTGKCTLYPLPMPTNAPKAYIHFLVPMPKAIVALMPVSCKIYPTGSATGANCNLYAVGLRFLYESAGVPMLNGREIPMDPSPDELQLSMDIEYVPFDFSNDTNDQDAICSFNHLSKLFSSDLTLEFDSCPQTVRSRDGFTLIHGPLHNCKAAILWVS